MTPSESDSKRKDFGRWAEDRAVDTLLAQGFTIRERNWRPGGRSNLEIDLIAQRDDLFVFVEVKARSPYADPAYEAVDEKKISKICRAADIYLRNMDGDVKYRFDIYTVTGRVGDSVDEHFPDAFLPPVN